MAQTQQSSAESTAEQLKQFASRVETTELGNGMTSVDFGLYRRTNLEEAHENQDPETYEARREKLARTGLMNDEALESMDENHQRMLDEGYESSDLTDADADIPTQRSGGMYRSSFIFDVSGIVVEYNIRLPPLDSEIHSQVAVNQRLNRICHRGLDGHPNAQGFNIGVFIREHFPEKVRENIDEVKKKYGTSGYEVPDKTWCPHIRSYSCSVSADDILDFTTFAVEEYRRRFDDMREWAVPDTQQSDVPESQGIDALEAVMNDFQWLRQKEFEEASFLIPGASERSRIRSDNGRVLDYELDFGTYDADEYGKILLRKAFEHVARKHDLLTGSTQMFAVVDGGYTPRIENPECSRALGDIALEIAAFVGHRETIDERSRLS